MAVHWLSSVVLPKPADAEMRVSFDSNPAFNFLIRCGRGISLGKGEGLNNFVDNIINQSYIIMS